MVGDRMSDFNKINTLYFWCQKVLPLVYDNSLSYSEVLDKISEKLNLLIENNNNLPEYISELIKNNDAIKEILSQIYASLEKSIANVVDNSETSNYDLNVNDLLFNNNQLYKVKRQIGKGDKYVIDSNIEATSIENLLDENLNTNNTYTDEQIAVVNDSITKLQSEIANIEKNTIYINVLTNTYKQLDNTGTVDNTNTLNEIINHFSGLSSGFTLFFPRGKYLFNNTVIVNKNHIRFLGEEKGATEIFTTNENNNIFNVNKCRFTTFEELAFWVRQGNDSFNNTALMCSKLNRLQIYNCMFYDFKNAITLATCKGTRIFNTTVSFDAISYSAPTNYKFSDENNSTTLNNVTSTINNTTGRHLQINGDFSDLYITHFESSGGSIGIELNGESQTVHNCNIYDIILDEPSYRGIYIHDLSNESELSINGGFISMLNNGSNNFRIENCYNINIIGVKCVNNHNLTSVDGFSFNTVNNINISNCYFYNMIRTLIVVASSQNISFNNNLINNNNNAGVVYLQLCKNGSVCNNIFNGGFDKCINIPSNSSNIMCLGNNGLLTAAVTNTYAGCFSNATLTQDLFNSFITA